MSCVCVCVWVFNGLFNLIVLWNVLIATICILSYSTFHNHPNFRSMKLYVYICNVCIYYWSPLACLWYGGTHISTSLNMMLCWLNIHLWCSSVKWGWIQTLVSLFFDYPEEWENKLFQNICNKLPLETTSCPRKLDLYQQCCETLKSHSLLQWLKCIVFSYGYWCHLFWLVLTAYQTRVITICQMAQHNNHLPDCAVS